jgi:hypothetical protein
MSLFEQWSEVLNKERTQPEHDKFWGAYLDKEKKIYEHILENHESVVEGKFAELAEKFNMNNIEFTGFIDGINTSLTMPYELDELSEDTGIRFEIDFEKLYYNMLGAKAEWLYNLSQWDDILTPEKRLDIKKDFNRERIAVSSKVGRNDPCPCGSGLKYKKCCGK